jgi:hypothetical protein
MAAPGPLTTNCIFSADGRFGCEADMAGPVADSTRSLVTQRWHSVAADCRRDRQFHSVVTSVDLHRAAWLLKRPDCIMD